MDGRNLRPALAQLDTGLREGKSSSPPERSERRWAPIWTPDGKAFISGGRLFTVGGDKVGVPDSRADAYREQQRAYTPDSQVNVVVNQGKFWRVERATARRTLIPFEAEVEQEQ